MLGAALGGGIALSRALKYDETLGFGSQLLLWVPVGIAAFLIADAATAAGYAFSPRELNVDLTKIDGTPRLETILIDADELQNVKWIRIHRR